VGPLLKPAVTLGAAVALLGAVSCACAEGDRNELFVGVGTAYFHSATDLKAWPEGGVGKLRYADDGAEAVRLFAEYHSRITPTLNARVVADYVDDGSSGLGITEAYMDWRPIPRSANQQQVRFGAFYPPLSLENGARGWESPFTYSYSAINTWLGVVAVPKTLIEVGKSFVAPDLVILRRIVLPATLPYIMAGVRLAVGRAVVAMVIAEFFTTISGLGAVIINSANNFDTATMFVPIIILMLMAIGLNWLIGFVERRVAPWQAEISGRDRE